MLCKLIKYDFWHSSRAFLPIGAVAIGIGLLMLFFMNTAEQWTDLLNAVNAATPAFLALSVAALLQIFRFYQTSLFGRSGYLNFTLPTSRGKILVSKLIVSCVWYVFSILIATVILVMMTSIHIEFGLNRAENIVLFLTFAPGAIAILFFCTTLAYSAFFGKRVHGLVSGLIGFVYALFGLLAANSVTDRHMHYVEFSGGWSDNFGNEVTMTWQGYQPQIGLQYGRLLISDTQSGRPLFLDLVQLGVIMAFSAVVIAATYYLLKRQVSL